MHTGCSAFGGEQREGESREFRELEVIKMEEDRRTKKAKALIGAEEEVQGKVREAQQEIPELPRPTGDQIEVKKWEAMYIDILVGIFQMLDLFGVYRVSQVCLSWRSASTHRSQWDTLDMRRLKSDFIPTREKPFVYVPRDSDKLLTTILRILMAISRGTLTCMIFSYNLYMNSSHLSLVAERSPHVKRLVLPAWNCITVKGICQAFSKWPELESLIMPSISNSFDVIQEIGRSCKDLVELKIMGTFNEEFAESIAVHMPKLKVLSLRCCILTQEALELILDEMENLEVLNISHCLVCPEADHLVLDYNEPSLLRILAHHSKMDECVIEKALCLRNFLYCPTDSCTMCQRMIAERGEMKWWKYEEDSWSQDEVKSLCLEEFGKSFNKDCLNLGYGVLMGNRVTNMHDNLPSASSKTQE